VAYFPFYKDGLLNYAPNHMIWFCKIAFNIYTYKICKRFEMEGTWQSQHFVQVPNQIWETIVFCFTNITMSHCLCTQCILWIYSSDSVFISIGYKPKKRELQNSTGAGIFLYTFHLSEREILNTITGIA